MAETNTERPFQPIDIDKVIASKDKKLLKKIPGFIIRYLKRIIHQDELNDFIVSNLDTSAFEFIDKGLEMFDVKIETAGLENLPADSKIIIVANHPLGGLDGVGLVKVIGENLDRGVKITANDLLMNLIPMRPVLLGVNKHGGNPKAYVEEMHQSFASDHPVIFLPSPYTVSLTF